MLQEFVSARGHVAKRDAHIANLLLKYPLSEARIRVLDLSLKLLLVPLRLVAVGASSQSDGQQQYEWRQLSFFLPPGIVFQRLHPLQ